MTRKFILDRKGLGERPWFRRIIQEAVGLWQQGRAYPP
jgi:hypothetical protein